jgi:hypothetical protein
MLEISCFSADSSITRNYIPPILQMPGKHHMIMFTSSAQVHARQAARVRTPSHSADSIRLRRWRIRRRNRRYQARHRASAQNAGSSSAASNNPAIRRTAVHTAAVGIGHSCAHIEREGSPEANHRHVPQRPALLHRRALLTFVSC